MLENLIKLQKQFQRPEVTPLVKEYNHYCENFLNKGYNYFMAQDMAIYKVKRDLIYKKLRE